MAVDLSKVAFTYYLNKKESKNVYVLKDINLHIENKGEIICIVGHTGSGKSTLMQLLNNLDILSKYGFKVPTNLLVLKKLNDKKIKVNDYNDLIRGINKL